MPRPLQRVCLQDGLKLDVNELLRQRLIYAGGVAGPFKLQWNHSHWGTISEGTLSARLSNESGWVHLEFPGSTESIELVTQCRHFGGRQWYFICPVTGREASVLWKPPGATRFCSRQAWKRQVAYRTQFLGRTDRAHHGKSKIKALLIGDLDPNDWELPPRPKRMRRATYQKLESKFDRYEGELDAELVELIARWNRRCN